MIDKLKKMLGIGMAETTDTADKTPPPPDDYGDVGELLEFARRDNRTDYAREYGEDKFKGKRFLLNAEIRNVMGGAGCIMVFSGDALFCFDKKYGAELIELERGQDVVIDALFEKLANGEFHFEDCRLVKETDNEDQTH